MSFQAGQSYNVKITSANAVESNSGTPGIQVTFENIEGAAISHTLWVTPRSAEFVARDLGTLGVPTEKLSSPTFMENLNSILSGRECNISLFSEEYPKGSGKYKVKVQYINPKRDASGAAPAHRIAEMFGGPKAAPVVAETAEEEPLPF